VTFLPGDYVDRSNVDETKRRGLEIDLRKVIKGEVEFDASARGVFATDSSNYRQVPLGVVFPLDEDDVRRAVEVCRRFNAPILGRGAGTSLAGQACNVAVIVDMSRHMNKILSIDPEQRSARVQPGVVLDQLNEAARALDLTFGPDPATHAWCTLGGMVGNNSCGTHGLYTGKTVDCVDEIVLITYESERFVLGRCDDVAYEELASGDDDRARIVRELRELRNEFAVELRTGFPAISRRVSGYNLEQLLPENGFHLARSIVGSESTCGLVTEILVSLAPWPKHRSLVVVGFSDVYEAADHVPALLVNELIGLEGFDARLVEQMRAKKMNLANIELLPPGGGWLLAEVGAATEEEAREKAQRVVRNLDEPSHAVVLHDHADQEKVWKIRESGLGATARPVGAAVNYEGWEDAAVAPENLGRYLRGVRDLWAEFGYEGAWYGHFGQGCVHTRNNFDLSSVEGLRKYRSFVERAADLCVSLGGSISGEHGDGQSRGELLSRMYSPRMMKALGRFKAAWDPKDRMNPGKVVDPYPLDSNIRYGPNYRKSLLVASKFSFDHDEGSMQKAVERCVGVGKCRSDVAGVMCPSYRATREETHSTRGRAKLFIEMFQGEVTPATWRNRDVFESLELCLSCKGCVSECPTQVDMATYKAEFLHHYYARRLRPLSAYALGLIPWTGQLASRVPRLANALLANKVTGGILTRVAGISSQRSVPRFAEKPFRHTSRVRALRHRVDPTVVLWPDSFTNFYLPNRGNETLEVLELVGEAVAVPKKWSCCGRPLYDSGMLSLARATARNVLDSLEEFLLRDLPVVVPEPSCLATFRDEFVSLLPDDERAAKLARLSCSLTEHLVRTSWRYDGAPMTGHLSIHPHCHQRAVQGSDADVIVLEQLGYKVEVLDLGCCGLAGSFGFQKDHDALSRKIAEDRFLPGIIDKGSQGRVIMDGFSCQLQAGELSNVPTFTTARLLADTLLSGVESLRGQGRTNHN
jgi:FAD/FMN-containing dehydrogenase/Fe-S oxidoreductase